MVLTCATRILSPYPSISASVFKISFEAKCFSFLSPIWSLNV